MSDASDTFFTSVGCMDGRVQEPIAEFGKKRYGVKFPDTITEAGLVGKYTEAGNDSDLGRSIKFKVIDVSVGKHHSKGIIVHGHQGCAGNPIDDETHKKQVLKSAQLMKDLNPSVEVLPAFVNLVDGNWEVEEL
jgi:carbonic anhydrase